jgi:hypothetical protein
MARPGADGHRQISAGFPLHRLMRYHLLSWVSVPTESSAIMAWRIAGGRVAQTSITRARSVSVARPLGKARLGRSTDSPQVLTGKELGPLSWRLLTGLL